VINHQLYSDWITSDDTLPTDSARELREHIQQCARCQALAEGWDSARRTIQFAGMEPAPAGFARRWKVMAEKRLQAPARRQAWIFLGATGLASTALGTVLAFQTLTQGFSLTGALTRSLTFAAGAVGDWSVTSDALGTITQAVCHAAPPAFWLGVIALLCCVFAGWLVFLYRFAHAGVRQ
jgi:anti-sigma factor RsiW